MNQLLRNTGRKGSRKGGKGCLFLILGNFATIAVTAVFVVTVLFLTRVVVETRHGDEAAYALLTAFPSAFPIAFALFTGILALCLPCWVRRRLTPCPFVPSGSSPPVCWPAW